MAAVAADRNKQLEELDLRHDRLLGELEDLNRRIEHALAQLKPPAAPQSPADPTAGQAAR